MYTKTFALFIAASLIVFASSSCKKSSSAPANPFGPHALNNQFYVRGLLDTSWTYQGNDNADECQSSGSVCSSFLTYGPNSSILAVKFSFFDSAHPAPKGATMLTWAGKTFYTSSDATASHAYTFTFEYPDTLGREMSSDYVVSNTGAKLTIDSVVYDGLAQFHTDSAGNPLKSYRVRGSISCKLTHFNDTIVHQFSQGVYCINVIESK